MRILFIYTNVGTYNPRNYQHGLGALAAFARQAGHHPGLLAFDELPAPTDFLRAVARFGPDLVGFHANSPQWAVTRTLAAQLKRADHTLPLVFGGTHPTTMPDDVLRSGVADFIVRGEGEDALVELARALERGEPTGQIANLGFMADGAPRLNPVRPLRSCLDDLPFADREIFDFQDILDANLGEAPYMAGRGCPFTCTYCCNNFLQKIYAGMGRYVRFRRPQAVVDDLARMLADYDFSSIYFQDDTFTLDMRWLGEFAALYAERIGLPYRAQARVDLVSAEMMDLLAASGCRHLNFGIEAGDERIRREVMGRPISDEQIESAFALARRRGIKLWSYNIIGTPGEGEEEIRRTIELNRRLEPDHVQVSIFNPYPGTELYHRLVADHSIDPAIADAGLPQSFFVELPQIQRSSLSDARLKALYEEFVTLAMQLAARRNPVGVVDFVEHLDEAEVETPAAEHVTLQVVTIGGDERLCLFAHPPARVSFDAAIDRQSRLVVGIAVNPQVWDRFTSALRFRIEIDGEEALSRELQPGTTVEHRRWLDVELAIPANGVDTRRISFITEAVGSADFAWALWSRPHLVHAEDP